MTGVNSFSGATIINNGTLVQPESLNWNGGTLTRGTVNLTQPGSLAKPGSPPGEGWVSSADWDINHGKADEANGDSAKPWGVSESLRGYYDDNLNGRIQVAPTSDEIVFQNNAGHALDGNFDRLGATGNGQNETKKYDSSGNGQVETLRRRVDRLGVAEPVQADDGKDGRGVPIQLPGVSGDINTTPNSALARREAQNNTLGDARTGTAGGLGGIGALLGGGSGGSTARRSSGTTTYAAPGSIGDAVFSISPENRSIVAIADSSTQEQIKQVLGRLEDRVKADVGGQLINGHDGAGLNVFEVANANPEEVTKTLKDIFDKNGKQSSVKAEKDLEKKPLSAGPAAIVLPGGSSDGVETAGFRNSVTPPALATRTIDLQGGTSIQVPIGAGNKQFAEPITQLNPPITWAGNNGTVRDINTTTNWTWNGAPTTYQQSYVPGDPVIFDNSGTPNIAVSNTLSPTTRADAQRLQMNFANVPLDTVLNYLSSSAGFTIAKDVQSTARLNLRGTQPMSKDEAVDMLNSELYKSGLAAIQKGGTLSIVTLDEAKTRGVPVSLWNGDPNSIPKSDAVVTMVLPVHSVPVAGLLQNLRPLVSSTTPLTANQAGNSIIITDTQANIRRVAEVIRAREPGSSADIAPPKPASVSVGDAEVVTTVKVFTLKYANPQEIAREIATRFPGGGVGSRNKVTAVADTRTASVIVTAPQGDIDRITATVNGLEEQKKSQDAALPKPAAGAPIPQPEIQTRDNAFSTFSLNVSDVSFKLAAASLEKGLMPEPASIRTEEFINAFDYRDPEAAPGAPIAFAWERAHDPFAYNRDLLRFSVKTAAEGRQAGRPLNLVLLLDNSGSMERADRVAIIREALRVLATQLHPQDKLSVVLFARTARLWVDGVSGDQAARVAQEVSGLTPQGGTNLEEAMKLAYEAALRHYLADGMNRVVLLTDGAANLGTVQPEVLKQMVDAHRKQGIALDCFGIGWEGYNDDLLEVLTRNGNGRYGFVNTPAEAASEFAVQLAGALHVAASDVKVQVEFNPGRVTSYRQLGYAKHQLTKEQFRDNTVAAAEIAAQEAGNAMYVVEVNPAGEGPVATVRVRYRTPGTSQYFEHEWTVPYTGNAVGLEQASPAMRLAGTASGFSEWLAGSPYAGEVTTDRLMSCLRGVPEVFGADGRPRKLQTMLMQAKSISGR